MMNMEIPERLSLSGIFFARGMRGRGGGLLYCHKAGEHVLEWLLDWRDVCWLAG